MFAARYVKVKVLPARFHAGDSGGKRVIFRIYNLLILDIIGRKVIFLIDTKVEILAVYILRNVYLY